MYIRRDQSAGALGRIVFRFDEVPAAARRRYKEGYGKGETGCQFRAVYNAPPLY